MAKGKKTAEVLTLEEKLEQALVPVEEWPYSIPENWCWTKIGKLSSLHRGVSYKKNDAHTLKEIGDCLIMRGGNIGEGYITTDADNVYVNKSFVDESQLVLENDIIIVASTGSVKVIGRAGISMMDYSDVSFGAFLMLVRPVGKSNPRYLGFFFQSDEYRNRIRNLASGVNINNIRADYITEMPIPFPPFAEQQRIVDHIEHLFSKLDEAKEKAQAVVDGFELRKSAILHKAFTGELTAQWRKDHGIKLDSWEIRPLIEVASLQTGLMKGKHYEGETVFLPYLRVANVQDGFLDLKEIKTIEINASNVERYLLKKGDVLFTEGGDFDKLGRGTVWEEEILNCLHQNHIFVVRPHKNILNPYFLSFQAGSKYGKSYFLSCSKQTTNLASINSTQLKRFPVKLPSLEEQLQIVSVIGNLFSMESQAKTSAESVLTKVDLIKKSILARAFRGELGTNDPAEENAVELLKMIL